MTDYDTTTDSDYRPIIPEYSLETDSGELANGVDRALFIEEEFVAHGEQIERETTLEFLDDGGLHIVQEIEEQGIFDSLTLSRSAKRRLAKEVLADD